MSKNDSIVAIYPSHTAAEAADKFVLIVHSSMDETSHARDILGRTKPDMLEHHQQHRQEGSGS